MFTSESEIIHYMTTGVFQLIQYTGVLTLLLLLSDAFHKNVSKAASRAQSQLDYKKPHRVEDILNK